MNKKIWKRMTSIIVALALAAGTTHIPVATAAENAAKSESVSYLVKEADQAANKENKTASVIAGKNSSKLNQIVAECEEIEQPAKGSYEIRKGQMVSTGAVESVLMTEDNTMAIMENGDLYCWGSNKYGQVGNGTKESQTTPVKVLSNVKTVFCSHSGYDVSAIQENGDLYCWGYNGCGEVGNGTKEDQTTPVKVLSGVKTVSCSNSTVLAIKENGDLYCWGYNWYGQVGSGTKEDQTTPIKVLSGVKTVSCFSYTVSAIQENGDLYCWGLNSDGQVGNGTEEDQTTPVKVLSGVKTISGYDDTVSAIQKNGDLYCWGRNWYGQLGNGTKEDQTIPVKVLSDVKTISGYYDTVSAIKENGDLYCWGYNKYGEVGNGTEVDQTTPVKVLSDVKTVSSSVCMTSAIKENGDLYCWGSNWEGEVGNGTEVDQTTPVKVLSDVKTVSCPYDTVSAIQENGDLYCWGDNSCGQVGNGTTEDQPTPVKVLGNITSDKKINVFAELTFDDRTKKKSLSWNKDGYTEEEIQLKVQLKGLGLTSLSMKEIHVELDNLKMFKVKDFKKVTNTGSKYEYTWELDRPLTQENESFEITLVKKGLTWWKPNDVNTYSGLINVTVVCADRSGNLYSNSRNNMNQVIIEYWNELKVQKKIDDQKKAEQEAEKNAGQYQKNAVNEFVDLSDKLELDPNVENCIGKNQYEALKMLIYTEISLADISKSYFTSAGLSDQVAELMMERFLGYKNPKFGIAEKTVPIEVVVAGASNKKYQFKFDCEVTLYLLNGVEFGINGRIKTQMWQVTAPNKKISTISCADGIINQGDLSNFSKAVWGVAKSSIQSAYKNVWGNDADKLANKVMEDSIDSIASKAAKYGLEKPVQLVLQAFYEEKLKSKFSSNFFQLLIYPSKMAVVRCPVDVYVYDSTNNLVGSIINDQATMYGDGVALWTEGDDKYIQLFDDTYQMIYKSTGEGTMDLDIYDSTCSDINYRNCAFSLVPLSDGLEYTQTINNEFLTDVDNYKLTSDKGDAISADKEEIMYQDEYPEESSDQADNNNSEENQQGSFSGTEQPANPDQTAGDNQNSNTNQQPEIDQSGDEYDDQDYEKNPDTVRIPKKGARLKSGTATYKVTRSGKKNGTVAFAKVSGNPSKVIIPASIEVGGITYKVTSIAANAFKNRRKLKTAKIGKNVARIGKKAFYGCKKLKRITIKTKKLTKKSVGSKAFSGVNKKVKVRAPGRKLSAYKKILSARGLGKR